MTEAYLNAAWSEALRWIWALGMTDVSRIGTGLLDALVIAFGVAAWRLRASRQSRPTARVGALARPKAGSL